MILLTLHQSNTQDNGIKLLILISIEYDYEYRTAISLLKNSGQNLVDGKDHIDTVYAVAQTENEVVNGLVDISAVNTQYTFVPNDKEPDVDGGDGNDNGGGGSSSLALLFGLLTLAGLRKR